MSTHLKILSKKEIRAFDLPPEFNGEERKRFFHLPQWATNLVDSLRNPTNKMGFALQLGYFNAVNKFFVANKFHPTDIEFVQRRLSLPLEEKVVLSKYVKATFTRHQQIIVDNLGFHKFNQNAKSLLMGEALKISAKQMKPKLMFWSLVDFLRETKIEIPSYYALSEIISDAYRHFETGLLATIEQHISPKEKRLLDEFLEIDPEYESEEKQDLKLKRYKLTLLKKSNQSTKPSRIKENVNDLLCLKELFEEVSSLTKQIDLSPEIIQYYAQVVLKSQVFQISRREDKRYLFLVAFVIHQYYRLNDVLIEILMQSVQTTLNTSMREHKENFYQTWREKHQTISDISDAVGDHLLTLRTIKEVIYNGELTDDEKIKQVKNLLPKNEDSDYSALTQQLTMIGSESKRVSKNEDYYDVLEAKSIKLQNRASEIVKHLEFDEESSDEKLLAAIEYYRGKDGLLSSDAPLEFLQSHEQRVVFDQDDKLRISLYKVLLFEKIASSLKSGALNLQYSYKYRAFDDYLIPAEVWHEKKSELLARAGLVGFEDFNNLQPNFSAALTAQYETTNENIKTERNQYVKIDSKGRLKLTTPKVEKPDSDIVSDLFPKDRYISLFEVLSTINQLSNFSDPLEHWHITHNRHKPDDKILFAGIIGLGCNLGIKKIAKISTNIAQNELENTVNWYFSSENLNRANDRVLELIEQLDLPKLYKKELNKTHTSSDGQKFSISVDSLNANYSYKYFGQSKGVSVYSFIDESHRLFYSTVINVSEQEAAYVIDGLMYNDVVQSDIHSTDTHGYSEMVFGVTHLLGISFAPRIKDVKNQRLYSFGSRSKLKELGYQILPDGRVNTKIIRDNWDEFLRFVTTIKLKETPASQLFRRLSSYSRQHPLYRASKEFGKIPKTLFLLRCIDDVILRQIIEKQMNKLENSNKFGKAVFYGNNQEFRQATKEEQLIAENCKRLIENAIICWNYLYLTQLILSAETSNQKQNLVNIIKNGSPVAWKHINLQGEYDFSQEKLKGSIDFRLPELLKVRVT